jgi:molybdopterin-containing oxidoreductase family membrane subunit
VPLLYLTIGWALLIQIIIAFLYAANVGRPFWHSGLLGPRFLASSFTAGCSLMILAFRWIGRHTRWPVQRTVIDLFAVIASIALLSNLFMLGMELFTELYHPTSHSASAIYLFFGLGGHWALVPWVWTAVGLQVVAAALLLLNRSRRSLVWLTTACVAAIVGVWIEKGMGLVVPGFLPTSLGRIHEYVPNLIETRVSAGIWALALILFTGLAKGALRVQGLDGEPLRRPSLAPPGPGPGLGEELEDDELDAIESLPPPPHLPSSY